MTKATMKDLIRLNQQFMMEAGEEGGGNPAGGEGGNPPAGGEGGGESGKSTGGDNNKEHMIPKSRFDEVNSKFKDVQTQLDTLLNEKQNAEKAAKEQQGKFEELYKTASDELNKFKDESKSGNDRVKQLEGVLEIMLNAKLEAVPEQYRDLVPANLTPEAKLEWLATAEAKGLFTSTTQKQNTPLGEGTNPNTKQNTDINTLSPQQLLRAAYGKK